MTPREKKHQLLAVYDTRRGDSLLDTVLVLFEVKFSSVHKRHVIRGVVILICAKVRDNKIFLSL
jgi:hypothetical protein